MDIDKDYNRLMILASLNSVKRKGMDKLLDWLMDDSDYYTAPASSRYHLSSVGGLAQHHWNVYRFFKAANREFHLGLGRDSVIVTSLLHDLCKCNLYIPTGNSYRCDPAIKDKGHAKQSIDIIKQFIALSDEEEAIIRYHMGTFGAFDYADKESGEHPIIDLHRAIKRYASVQIFAACDMGSSRFERCFGE